MILQINGQVPSKSNGYKIAGKRLIKSKELKEYEQSFAWQSHNYTNRFVTDFGITIRVYFQSKRSDLDNSAKIILDCLQAKGIILNDRNCQVIQMYKFIDKENPRIELYLYDI